MAGTVSDDDRPESLPSSSFRSLASSFRELTSSFRKTCIDENCLCELPCVEPSHARKKADETELQWAAIERVGLGLPTVEVRYKDLCIDADTEVIVPGKCAPSIWNTLKSAAHGCTSNGGCSYLAEKVRILENVTGVLKPGRMTLLLGPPGCGKTTLLKALAGKTEQNLKIAGEVTYNGYNLDEFVPQKTSAYISQYDLHISELTVRETLDFSARCQGVGGREDFMREISRREKQAGVTPEPNIDAYMKAISIEGLKRTLQTDYIMKILGLDICANTIVGDAMVRGISGGEKRRLTTGKRNSQNISRNRLFLWPDSQVRRFFPGEMIIGPARVLLMDGISTGLDTSTTFQIVTCLQHLAHLTDSTILVSLLQPSPETFDLFDDIILMAEGRIIYHGPRTSVLSFFDYCGFKCPTRKGVGDFLQEVVSKKDQAQYWKNKDVPYAFVSPEMFAKNFLGSPTGMVLNEELSKSFLKTEIHRSALASSTYSSMKWEVFKACLAREWLLMKRNSFIYVYKSAQLLVVAVILMTVFIRTRMRIDVVHGNAYMASLFYALIRLMANGIPELSLTVSRLGVFYKHRDFYFYPAWAYSIPAAILKIPFSFLDALLWTTLTYYVVGYSPGPLRYLSVLTALLREILQLFSSESDVHCHVRFFRHLFLLFLVHQVSISLFRLIASVVHNPSVAATCGLFSLMVMFLFGGFVIPKPSLPGWLGWGFWLSPLSYAEIAASTNEFHAPRWQKVSSGNATIGLLVLENHGLNFRDRYYWICVGALIGFWVFFNCCFTCALSFSKSIHLPSPQIFQKIKIYLLGKFRQIDMDLPINCSFTEISNRVDLPFEPMTLTFEKVQYLVETPKQMKDQGHPEDTLKLLHDITGAFRPGVLTALMGVSGAGKTTLMDVLSGRKTGGITEGDIRVGGKPKVQDIYARISAYCEQTDIHSPQLTVGESLAFSARLRLPEEIDKSTRDDFIREVLEIIELDDIKDAIVGIPGKNGLSMEQRKRLTIAVELLSNPSIVFMDEPTSGLDARAAAIVMRVVKNIVSKGRTIVCTIHQPSVDIFEAFDELILLKRGGQLIYCGELGEHSGKLIEYFEGIPGIPKIPKNYNPATWLLEITSPSMEIQLSVDFNLLYKESRLCKRNEQLVRELNSPKFTGSKVLFLHPFPRNGWEQFKACLWKQRLTYWRNPAYNLARLAFAAINSLVCAALLWQKGQKINDEQDLINILGVLFIFVQFTGPGNCSSVIPFIAMERVVVYRERFAGMYSLWSYALAQLLIEIPYVFVQALLFTAITYPAIGFYSSSYKVFWYFYSMFCTLLYFSYYGMMLVSLSTSYQVASIWASFSYTMFNIFAGYLMPEPMIPVWWRWGYWICPTAWTLKGLITSQYGDMMKGITAYGKPVTLSVYLRSHFRYNHNELGIVAAALLAFPLAFACIFAYAVAKLNFQKR
ncbi:hypothetical protein MLD38_015745 [Melastoma candidum]|uniref:Uncharacterized protein n=1 Tax=Melastoma candidum TaxID=119954 RepID=A0ACB9RJ12_9MYRT|nr:hypothetical protein MLD38_015745 [Melastoma candidum]